MLLTKGEKGIGLITSTAADVILAELKEQLGEPVEIRHSLASGYVRVGYNYIAHYNGRFGTGITIRHHNGDSTRYCYKCTYIWDVGKNVIGGVIERCIVTF